MNANALREDRMGVLVHYSDGDYASTVEWCKDPVSKVSYNTCIGPDGQIASIVPYDMRAWHAGVCRTSNPDQLPYHDANSAFEGLALSGGPQFGPPTDAQVSTLVTLIKARFAANGWDTSETWRITGHDIEAWPRGRKEDPTGPDRSQPWLSLDAVRDAVAT